MCRSIKTLRRKDDAATNEEVRAAALQYVRKISGYRTPSRGQRARRSTPQSTRSPAPLSACWTR